MGEDGVPFQRPSPSLDPFWSAYRRLLRADKHIDDLELAVRAWVEAQPFAQFTEINPGRTHESHTLGQVLAIPDIISDCAFDAASNLRACLDSAVYAIVSAHAPSAADKTHFPIADTKAHFDGLITGRHRGAFPDEIADVFRQLEPYERGNGHLIWTLNRIRRQAEHRVLIRCTAKASFRLVNSRVGPGSELQFFEYVESGEDDTVFAITPIGSDYEFEAEATINITFGDGVDVAARQPVVQLLKAIRKQTSSAIDALASEAQKIGLLQRGEVHPTTQP